jgi:hypothetical protein
VIFWVYASYSHVCFGGTCCLHRRQYLFLSKLVCSTRPDSNQKDARLRSSGLMNKSVAVGAHMNICKNYRNRSLFNRQPCKELGSKRAQSARRSREQLRNAPRGGRKGRRKYYPVIYRTERMHQWHHLLKCSGGYVLLISVHHSWWQRYFNPVHQISNVNTWQYLLRRNKQSPATVCVFQYRKYYKKANGKTDYCHAYNFSRKIFVGAFASLRSV